jgi:predicted DNA-binding protein YlxM (UPF0122 family)
MAILSAFFDESGKFHDKKVISLSALCTTDETLTHFHDKWQELLSRCKLQYLKASEALKEDLSLSEVLPKQSVSERIEALKPFAACIGEKLESATTMAVNVDAFQRTKEHVKKQISGGDNPYYFSFLRVVLACTERANGANISLIFDDDQETAENCFKLYRRLKNLEESWRDRFCAITFADDRVFSALQAADMVSGLFRLEGENRFFNKPYKYLPLLEYMTQDRGPTRTAWGFMFVGDIAMAKIEMAWGKTLG